MKLFRVDGPIYNFMDTLKNLFLINVCLIICSIPIVTFGAAVVAAYDVTLRMVKNEEGYVTRQFFQAFKANIKQGCILGLITLGCAEVVWLDYQLATDQGDESFGQGFGPQFEVAVEQHQRNGNGNGEIHDPGLYAGKSLGFN